MQECKGVPKERSLFFQMGELLNSIREFYFIHSSDEVYNKVQKFKENFEHSPQIKSWFWQSLEEFEKNYHYFKKFGVKKLKTKEKYLNSIITTSDNDILSFFNKILAPTLQGSQNNIEVGGYFGAATCALASGVNTEKFKGKIYSYDSFIYEQWMEKYAHLEMKEGCSFFIKFQEIPRTVSKFCHSLRV